MSSPLKQTLGSNSSKDIISTEVSKYIINVDNKLTLNLPDINEVKIAIDDRDLLKIDNEIYWSQWKTNEINKESDNNSMKNSESVISQIVDLRKQMKKNVPKYTIDKLKIEKAKIDQKAQYDEAVFKSIKLLANFFCKTFENSDELKDNDELLYEYIPDYQWLKAGRVVSDFNNLMAVVKEGKYMHTFPYFKKAWDSYDDCIPVIAENIFSSFWRLWTDNEIDIAGVNVLWNKIKKRHEIINYSIQNLQLDESISRIYCKKLLSFLEVEVNMNRKTNSGDFKVGCYNGDIIDSKLIEKFPFEVLISINSTFARIKTLTIWNELSSWPEFLRQTSFDNVFGFTAKDLDSFYSKSR